MYGSPALGMKPFCEGTVALLAPNWEQVAVDWAAILLGLDDAFHMKPGQGARTLQGIALGSALRAVSLFEFKSGLWVPTFSREAYTVHIAFNTSLSSEEGAASCS